MTYRNIMLHWLITYISLLEGRAKIMMQYTPDEVKDEPAVGALIPATNDSQVGRETATQ